MTESSLDEAGVDYYLNVLCPMADHAFQFTYSCVLNRAKAVEVVKAAFQSMSENLPTPGDGDSEIIGVIAEVWKKIDKDEKYSVSKLDHKIFSNLFQKLSLEERALLALVDYLGFETEAAAKVLGKSIDQGQFSLSKGRQALVEYKLG